MSKKKRTKEDAPSEGRDKYFMDIDRMVSEGLGGGQVTEDNGLISQSTTDTMDNPESVIDSKSKGKDKKKTSKS